MIYANTSVKPYRQPPAKRNIILWKHADMDKIRDSADQLSHRITAQYSTQTPINTLWQEFQLGVDNILKSLPSKMTSSRFSQPWVNRTIKRNARRKQRAYNKARNSGSQSDWSHFKRLQKLQRVECRNSPDLYQRPKRFWSYINSRKCDNNGVAPLRDNDGLIYSDPKKKADILKNQFSSVFTQELQATKWSMTYWPNPKWPPFLCLKCLVQISREAQISFYNQI